MKTERSIGKRPALGGPYGFELWEKNNWPICRRLSDPDRFPQFTQDDVRDYAEKAYAAGVRVTESTYETGHYPAALVAEKEQRRAYALSFFKERRARRAYQVLALLGWAATVVMGVWG